MKKGFAEEPVVVFLPFLSLAGKSHFRTQKSRPQAALSVNPEKRAYLTIWFSSPLA